MLVGYRGFDRAGSEPLFAFGHGLSYTTFKYGAIKLSNQRISADGDFTTSIKITNTGKRAGDEVVQLYIHELKPAVTRPAKELRGFKRIHLEPGESQTVSITVPASKLAFYDESIHAFRVNAGPFEILVGAASDDIRARAKVEVTAK